MNLKFAQPENRIGFHYFPDTAHYTNKDLNTYLPFLEKMKVGWLVLLSETSRAIPEQFITGLVAKGINPIIHFPLRLPDSPAPADLKAILNAYASWGVKYVILFDRPNDRSAWSASGWSQSNLVENFLDRFIPLANECVKAGLTPVFSPLEPGGSYWDLSFLRTALQALQRRNQKTLLNALALSVYAYTFARPLDWGKGGPERWPGNKPYITPSDSQDQKGFRGFEWINAITQSTLSKSLPLILLGMGQKSGSPDILYTPDEQSEITRQILSTLKSSDEQESSTQNILAGNFWLLSATSKDPAYAQAWIKEDGSTLPVVNALSPDSSKKRHFSHTAGSPAYKTNGSTTDLLIQQYLLLPLYEWGVADWHLEVIKPYVRKHHPTVGFSLSEAALAKKVIVIGGEQSFPEEELNNLRNQGCEVERISGDGTSIATQLSAR